MRFFNTAGPVNPEDHYCIPPLERIDIEEIEMLIRQKKCFLIHAPRQTGKTTILNSLVNHLNQGGIYNCVYINVEPAQAAREDVAAAMQAILARLGSQIRRSNAKEGHLVIFNRNSNVSWEDKIFCREAEQEDTGILIWGM